MRTHRQSNFSKSLSLLIFFIVFFVISCNPTYQRTRFGQTHSGYAYIDTTKVFNKSRAGDNAMQFIDSLITYKQSNIDAEKVRLGKFQADYEKRASNVPFVEREQLRKEFELLVTKFQQLVKEEQGEVDRAEAELREHIIDRVEHIAQKKMYQHGFKAIFELSSRSLLAGSADSDFDISMARDITTEVIYEIDRDEQILTTIDTYYERIRSPEPPVATDETIYAQEEVRTPDESFQTTTENSEVSFSEELYEVPITDIKNHDAIAIVIGNRNYVERDIPDVDFALNDAQLVKTYLRDVFGYREENIIYAPNASKAKFEALFGTETNYRGRLHNYLKKGKSDIFIYYSGHGAPDVRSKKGHFIPVDADPLAINLTGYSLQQFYDNIAKVAEEMKTPNVFIVVDACFSGATEKGLLVKNMSPISISVENPLLTIPNAVVITSSSGSEVSSWYPEKKHGLFTYFFLQTLKKESEKGNLSKLTAGRLFSRIVDETEGVPYYARRLHGRVQTPQLIGDKKRFLFRE